MLSLAFPGALLLNTCPSLHPCPLASVCERKKRAWQPNHLSLLTPQAWIWRHPPITCRPRPTCASSRSSTTRTSSLSFPTSWRLIASENRGFRRPPPGPSAPDTQALCTMSRPHSNIFPLEQLPAPRERVGWTYPGTHKPVYPAEVLSLLLLQAETTPCWFLLLQGEGAESSFLCPLPSRAVPGFPASFPKQEGK